MAIFRFVDSEEYEKIKGERRRTNFIEGTGHGYSDDGSELDDEETDHWDPESPRCSHNKRPRSGAHRSDGMDSSRGADKRSSNVKTLTTYFREMPEEDKPTKIAKIDSSTFEDIDCLAGLEENDDGLANKLPAGKTTATSIRKNYALDCYPQKRSRPAPYLRGWNRPLQLSHRPSWRKIPAMQYEYPSSSLHINTEETSLSDNESIHVSKNAIKQEYQEVESDYAEVKCQDLQAEYHSQRDCKTENPSITSDALIKAVNEKFFNDEDYFQDESLQKNAVSDASFIDKNPSAEADKIEFEEFIDANGCLPFYFLDAWEDANGAVYLFGKVLLSSNTIGTVNSVSCCVIVSSMMRRLFIIPRLGPTEAPSSEMVDATEVDPVACCEAAFVEFKKVRSERGIKKLKFKLIHRNYCFELAGMKRAANQLVCDVRIPGDSPPLLDKDLKGTHYSHILGSTVSLLERLLVKRNIMGPSWLRLSGFSLADQRKRSWCRFEVSVENEKNIRLWLDPKQSKKIQNLPGNTTTESATPVERMEESAAVKIPENSALPLPALVIMSLRLFSLRNAAKTQEVCMLAYHALKNYDIDNVSNVVNTFKWTYRISIESVCTKLQPDYKTVETRMERFVAICKQRGNAWPSGFESSIRTNYFKLFDQEKSLLSAFLSKIQELDPDIIIGHSIYGNDLEILGSRFCNLKLMDWHKLSRLKRPKLLKVTSIGKSGGGLGMGRMMTAGRIICDTYLQAKEISKSLPNYQLDSLVKEYIPLKNPQMYTALTMDQSQICYQEAFQLLNVAYTILKESEFNFQITLKLQALPLTKELSNLAGNLWAKSLQNARAERNEYLLLHEFTRRKFLCPDPKLSTFSNRLAGEDIEVNPLLLGEQMDVSRHKKKAAYAGGLVLEPKAGLYDTFVLLLDFNSLYPSIIQEFNVCFTTVERPDESHNEDFQVTQVSHKGGILPSIVKRLVNRRKAIKEKLKNELNENKRFILDIRQKALKLTANSLYGCLGFAHSRFYAKSIAAYITQQGRTVLQNTKEVVENELHYDIIYGDTDSIMINTGITDEANMSGYKKALEEWRYSVISMAQVASKLKATINKRYKKLEIDLDAIFRRLLLLKKKKYACVKILNYEEGSFVNEHKGLDIVRRDWCSVAKEVGKSILENAIFPNEFGVDLAMDKIVEKIYEILRDTNNKLHDSSLPLHHYVITKTLTKPVHLYAEKKGLPHVSVAARLLSNGYSIQVGNEIPYIICSEESVMRKENTVKDPPPDSDAVPEKRISNFAERAFSLEEIKKRNLLPDLLWYKTQQLLPVITRLCSHIVGIDSGKIAECFGLDREKYSIRDEVEASSTAFDTPDHIDGTFLKRSKEKYASYPLAPPIKCPNCQQAVSPDFVLQCMHCEACNFWIPLHIIRNWVMRFLYQLLIQFSMQIRRCSDCGLQTRSVRIAAPNHCPNVTCHEGTPLTSALLPSDVCMYLEKLKYLLDKPLDAPGDSEKKSSKSLKSKVFLSVTPDFQCTVSEVDNISSVSICKFDDLCYNVQKQAVPAARGTELKHPHVIAFIRYVEKVTKGSGMIDYRNEREFLKKIVEDLLKKNAYSELGLRDIFSIFIKSPGFSPHS
ncbi:Dna polymerase (pol2) superfamily protein [Cardiosporidium cionae]|uniref:DNA polymerase n=1 Tax=Cardiosporidium cionae TaxID=476202 RepID=A0ABQ7JE46_9APIC|nr:Dna polymerase (pol2) superfamily protein [Cardiosporidium cionae]|eukprot:KAF8822244.1 Dna polymerase (pol2) superfamily protein [Cardiosporidium cionae]